MRANPWTLKEKIIVIVMATWFLSVGIAHFVYWFKDLKVGG